MQRLDSEIKITRRHAFTLKAELSNMLEESKHKAQRQQELRSEAIAAKRKQQSNPTTPTVRQVKVHKVDTQPEQDPSGFIYGPYASKTLQTFETQHVLNARDESIYPSVLYLRTNHRRAATLTTMLTSTKAHRLLHSQRAKADLSNAVCYGTTHDRPCRLQGALVIYYFEYQHDDVDKTMYWCSKCAAATTPTYPSMRVGKKASAQEYAQNNHKGIFKT
jgi:cell division septum initiation protein DivIVA